MRPAAIRGAGNCQGRREDNIFKYQSTDWRDSSWPSICAGQDIHHNRMERTSWDEWSLPDHLEHNSVLSAFKLHARRNMSSHFGSRGRPEVVRASEVVSRVSCMSTRDSYPVSGSR